MMVAVNQRPVSRREREAARAKAARGRKMMVWAGVALVVVAGLVVLIVVLTGGGDDEPSVLTPEELVAKGGELFTQNCATCHGRDLTGTFVGPPLLHEIYAPDRLPDDAIRAAVANGVSPHNWDFSGMPPFPNLDADDVDALIAFVRSSQRAAGLPFPDTVAPTVATAP